jgi:hypothetical protein
MRHSRIILLQSRDTSRETRELGRGYEAKEGSGYEVARLRVKVIFCRMHTKQELV